MTDLNFAEAARVSQRQTGQGRPAVPITIEPSRLLAVETRLVAVEKLAMNTALRMRLIGLVEMLRIVSFLMFNCCDSYDQFLAV